MTAPAVVARRPAPPGTLPGDFLDGVPAARRRFAVSETPAPRGKARLDASALRFRERDGDAVRRILAGEGRFVTTGQQPLLFLGPLFVLYKVLAAVEAARRCSEAWRMPVLPLFWIASDDHDWEEVARTRLLDRENRLRELRLDAPAGRRGRAVGPSALPAAVDVRRGELAELLGETEFTGCYLSLLEEAWRPGTTFAAAFADTLHGLLPELPIVSLDAACSEVRRAGAPLMGWAVTERSRVDAAIRAGSRAVQREGWAVQLVQPEGAPPVFLEGPGGRARLQRDGDGLRLGADGPSLSEGEVLGRLEEAPDAFSPAAALRPVLESWLLPVGATILGPGEIGYWGQLRELFEAAEVEFPPVAARFSWTLLEEKVAKVLRKVDAAPGDLDDGGETLRRRIVERGRPPEVEEAIEELRAGLGRGLDEVEEAIEAVLPGIRSAVGKARAGVFGTVAELEKAVDARVRERQRVELEQVEKAAVHLHPGGRPQERVLSPFYYLARYGDAVLRAVEEAGASRGLTAVAGLSDPA